MNNWEKSFEIINRIKSVTCSLPDDVFLSLKKECNKVKNKKTRDEKLKLIGHINEEYFINNIPKNLNDFILGKVLKEDVIIKRTLELSVVSKDLPFYIDKLWVNFQKKHEFNPPHNHAGIYSFVIFVKIPYDLEKEEKYFTKSFTNKPMTSKFAFQYVDINGDISIDTLDVDKSFEGKIVLFPSKQIHTVFPFYTSNDYRVTVSGNIKLKVD
jgi:hypothetical protein